MNLIKFCKDLYNIPRSLTGKGVLNSLKYIQSYIPLEIKKARSGSQVFDWTIPPEWNISGGYIVDLTSNKKIIDFKNHNLHIVGYSAPIDKTIDFDELNKHLYYLEEQPEAIPYITSYYNRTWGFCLSYNTYRKINKTSKFRVVINSEFNEKGYLHYGELVIPGKIKKEIFFSSYICHPQMVNNELSGPAVLTAIAKKIIESNPYYTYRFILIPETIGSIMYLSKNLKHLKKYVFGGFNLTCLGDDRNWSLMPSRKGNNISDIIAQYVLDNYVSKYQKYSWLDRGSDERQYCAPNVDLPICSIMRSKYGTFDEYHTSLDNFNLVNNKALNESVDIYMEAINIFEKNFYKPKINVFCEPQLGKRGMYPKISTKESGKTVRNLMNFISFCDGENTILDISFLCRISFNEAFEYFLKLKKNNLI